MPAGLVLAKHFGKCSFQGHYGKPDPSTSKQIILAISIPTALRCHGTKT